MRRCLLLPVPPDGMILLPAPLGALSAMPQATAPCWWGREEGRTLILLPGTAARTTQTWSRGHGGCLQRAATSLGDGWGQGLPRMGTSPPAPRG